MPRERSCDSRVFVSTGVNAARNWVLVGGSQLSEDITLNVSRSNIHVPNDLIFPLLLSLGLQG